MARNDRALADAYFHGLIVNPEAESEPGHPCLYRVSRPSDTLLDDLWLVWISSCFYRKPRTQVVYKDWDLAFAAYCIDIKFNASKGEEPRYPNKDMLRRAALRCRNSLRDKHSDFSKLKSRTQVAFVQYFDGLWGSSIHGIRVADDRSADTSEDSSSASPT